MDRQGEDPAGYPHQQRLDDRQGERQADGERRARALARFDFDRAVDLLNVGAHHVQAHATARHVAQLLGGAQARRKDQLHRLLIGHALRLLLAHHASLDSLALHPIDGDTPAVIVERDHDEAVSV